ncbi:MAG: hypothetical protein LRY41_02185 [Candidatus Pacebacteria bacterium]|nr:hypothetical protein [Candidatus Paceibacterota bacterium]MCD8508340.1 hypothetical protein [Candidatus Paceibacterota bacterium]MCD8528115.1 hypothetical protein [Candidatus Paceibacterota bacterium]MCD8563613.1 hypothetical protein [Candidatus Paceibacterota bacterium]
MDRLELPKGLRGKIIASIKSEEIRRARMYVFVALATIATSSLGAVFAFKYMLQGFYQSSFYSYFSLIFSDPDIAVSYWKELSLPLIETVPFVGITLALIALATLLTSMRVLVNNAKPHLMPSFNN